MLRKFLLSLTAIILLSLSALAAKDNPNQSLIIYYSLNDNTEVLASKLQNDTDADIFRIETKNKYPDNYKKLSDRLLREVTYKSCPKLQQKKISNLYQYNTVYLLTPVYYGDIAPAMRSFLKANKLKGKTVIPFFVLENGGIGNAWKTAKKLSGKTHFKEGFEYTDKDINLLDTASYNLK